MNDDVLKKWAARQSPAVPDQIVNILSLSLAKFPEDQANAIITKIDTENLPMMAAVAKIKEAALPTAVKTEPVDQKSEAKPDRPEPASKPVEGDGKPKPRLPGGKTKSDFFAPVKKGKSNKFDTKTIMIAAAAVVVILVLLILGALMLPDLIGGGDSPTDYYASPLPVADPSILVPSPTEVTVTGSGEYWQSLSQVEPEQKSPGVLGYLTALTGFGIFLRLLLGVWGMLDANVRKKNQPAAMLVMCLSIAAGWLTLPILNFLAGKPDEAGWFIVGALVLGVMWAIPTAMIWVQKDKTPLAVALSIFVSSVFYAGELTIIPVLGTYFGASWPLWEGAYSLGGMFALIWGGRAVEAALTMFVYMGGLAVIALSVLEVGKGKRQTTALMIGGAVIAVFLLSSWGIGALFNSLLAGQTAPTVELVVLLALLRPMLAWVISLVVSIGIGVARGDIEVGGVGENKASQGLGLTQYIQNVADFAFLGTVIPLFLGVIMVLI